MMKSYAALLIALVVAVTGVSAPAAVQAGSTDHVGKVVTYPVAPMAWQLRRQQTHVQIKGVMAGDKAALAAFDKTLTAAERRQLTPLETMELFGVFYVPREGVEASMPVILTTAMLGWYDALRFGSKSGQEEIKVNAQFFKLPFIAGPEGLRQLQRFLTDHPAEAQKAGAQAAQLFDRLKDTQTYDRRWPAAFGMELFLCGEPEKCAPPAALPKEKWGAAAEEAKAYVLKYYRITK